VSGSTVYVGGAFTSIGGQVRGHIAAIDVATGTPNSWNPNADDDVDALALGGDGTLYAGGAFSSIGALPQAHFAAFSP
jgi:hypothetical protein